MAHKTGNAVRNPVDGPYNTHFQGGMWRIFKGDAQANLPSGRTLEEALATCDEWNLKAAAMSAEDRLAELKQAADRAYSMYDRAARQMGANDDECSVLYHAFIKANDAWQAAVRAA